MCFGQINLLYISLYVSLTPIQHNPYKYVKCENIVAVGTDVKNGPSEARAMTFGLSRRT